MGYLKYNGIKVNIYYYMKTQADIISPTCRRWSNNGLVLPLLHHKHVNYVIDTRGFYKLHTWVYIIHVLHSVSSNYLFNKVS